MKLGIVVVYLVAEDDGPLLELHLDQIKKHTFVPYTIYAGTNRLLPKFAARLRERPEVKICSLTSTELRAAAENSIYLEQLVEIAIADGMTHIVAMHPDSMPIRDRWAEELSRRVAGTGLAALERGPYTACLFFSREFYLDHHPHFLLSDGERASPMYREFSKRHQHLMHSGIGYLFRAFAEGIRWYSLPESSVSDAFGVIYDGLVFHLHGNARLQVSADDNSEEAVTDRLLYEMRTWFRRLVPRPVRRALWERFGDSLSLMDSHALRLAKRRIFENPEAYFSHILEH
jgi:hypothetical protein